MCWVMPPASPLVTSAPRMASNKLVLPWSTCPITATTGGRASPVPAVRLTLGAASVSSFLWASSIFRPNSATIIWAVSKSIRSLTVARTPFFINSAIRAETGIDNCSARVPTVMLSSISMVVFASVLSSVLSSAISTLLSGPNARMLR